LSVARTAQIFRAGVSSNSPHRLPPKGGPEGGGAKGQGGGGRRAEGGGRRAEGGGRGGGPRVEGEGEGEGEAEAEGRGERGG